MRVYVHMSIPHCRVSSDFDGLAARCNNKLQAICTFLCTHSPLFSNPWCNSLGCWDILLRKPVLSDNPESSKQNQLVTHTFRSMNIY